MDALGLGSVPVVGHCVGGWLASRLGRYDRPALVLLGRDDRLVRLAHGEAYANELGDVRLEVLDQAGRGLHIERTEKVADMVEGFLTD